MAEGFARHYGSDVLTASSSGLSPLTTVVSQTVDIMGEKFIDISGHVPRFFTPVETPRYDVVVNMSGMKLPGIAPGELIVWDVKDPYRQSRDVYLAVRDDIEGRVMRLILHFRRRVV